MPSTNERTKYLYLPPPVRKARRGLGYHARFAVVKLALRTSAVLDRVSLLDLVPALVDRGHPEVRMLAKKYSAGLLGLDEASMPLGSGGAMVAFPADMRVPWIPWNADIVRGSTTSPTSSQIAWRVKHELQDRRIIQIRHDRARRTIRARLTEVGIDVAVDVLRSDYGVPDIPPPPPPVFGKPRT